MNLFLFLAKRNDFAGTAARLLLMFAILFFAFLIGLAFAFPANQVVACQWAFALTLLCFSFSHVASEFPRGDDFVIVRLSISIALRTGLLLALMFLVNRDLLNQGIIHYILAFYGIGLFTDVILTVLRIQNSSSGLPSSVSEAESGHSLPSVRHR